MSRLAGTCGNTPAGITSGKLCTFKNASEVVLMIKLAGSVMRMCAFYRLESQGTYTTVLKVLDLVHLSTSCAHLQV